MQKLSLYRPTRSSKISQHFGESLACSYPNGKIVGKKNGVCPIGSVDFYESIGLYNGHNGMDIPGITGEHICHAGTFDGVLHTESDPAGGLGVDVVSTERLFFAGKIPSDLVTFAELKTLNGVRGFLCHVKVRYWHLHGFIGYDGKKVSFGQPIGLLGSTGASSGPHLHWSWKFCNEEGQNLMPNNGSYGAFDPESTEFGVSYYHDVFAGDSAEYLGVKKELTVIEKQNISKQLSIISKLLITLRELIAKI